MKLDFDPDKNVSNQAKHGLRFEDVATLDWDNALFEIDQRREYGEERIVAYAMKAERLHLVCFTMRGDAMRILSFRKANKREQAYYEQETADR